MSDSLNPAEIEFFVQTLKPSDILSIGTKNWFDEHHRLERLRQRCVYEAINNVGESVKDVVLTCEKLPVLVHEAVLIQVWRQKVWKKIIKEKNEKLTNGFVAYMILYHECTAVNFLQILLHHHDTVENLKEESLDLIDYCASQIVYLTSEEDSENDEMGKLKNQQKEMMLNTGLASIAIIASLAEYLSSLSLSAIVRIYETHDFPILLVNMLRIKPWKKSNQVYHEGRWTLWDSDQLSKNEAQCWIAIRGLLFHEASKQHYELTAFRKNNLASIQKFLTENIMDQLSPLMELKQYLGQLSISGQYKPNRTPLILETVAPIHEQLLRQNSKWKQLAGKTLNLIFGTNNHSELVEIAKSVAETYDEETMANLDISGSCAGCGLTANKKCSQCKQKFYCSRQCQVNDWNEHKKICHLQN